MPKSGDEPDGGGAVPRGGRKHFSSQDLATAPVRAQGTLRSDALVLLPARRRETVIELRLATLSSNGTALMNPSSNSYLVGDLTNYEAQVARLEDVRPHPAEPALHQLGGVLMNELLDVTLNTALEDFPLLAEALIGAFHSASQRIEREADKARDEMNRGLRDFDGSEVADSELQDATRKARAADVAVLAVEMIRDAAAQAYTNATGEVWAPWKGTVKATRITAAQIEAKDAIRANKAARHAAVAPGTTVIAFRAAPQADTEVDANRIFDALNWALSAYPTMTLATTGLKGAEKLAIKWAQQKKVPMVLAKADFDRHSRAAPFRANDELMALEPCYVLTLANTLDANRSEGMQPFGPALNLAQEAAKKGVPHIAIRVKP